MAKTVSAMDPRRRHERMDPRRTSWAPRSTVASDWTIRLTVVAGALSVGAYAVIAGESGLARAADARWGLWGAAVFAAVLAVGWTVTSAMIRGRPALAFVILADVGIGVGVGCLGDPFHAVVGCVLFAIIGAFACFFLRWRGFAAHLVAVVGFLAWTAARAELDGVTVIAASIVFWVVVGIPIVVRVLWVRSEQTARLAFVDPLTGAANRAGLERNARLAVPYAERKGLAVLVVAVDLDEFKSVNDRFGHCVGDAVIVETARHLYSHFGSTSTVARSGGEEFTVLALGSPESLRRSIRTLVTATPGVRGPRITMSVGAVFLHDHHRHPEPLAAAMFAADAQMYAVKASGGNGRASAVA